MKKIFLLFFFVQGFSLLIAQSYSCSKTTGTYTTLSTPTVVSTSTPWTPFQSHTIPIGFNFGFFDQTFSTIYIEGSGFTRFDVSYNYLINPFTVQMQDMGTGGPTSLSPLSYELTGANPNRILKIQWQNCELVDDPGSIANFQLWLYETSNMIEVHIGNCNIVNPSTAFQDNATDGPVVGIFDYVQSIGNAVNGTPPSEAGMPISSLTLVFNYSMTGVPTNGTIYTFSLTTSFDPPYQMEPFIVYPNPSSEEIWISGAENVSYKLINLSGQIVQQGVFGYRVNIESLLPGIYVLEFMVDGKMHSGKLIKQ